MLNIGIRSFVALFFWALAWPVMAVQVDGLFESERLVADQSAENRTPAVRDGLAEVLVRVSGHQATLESEKVIQLLERSESYLAQFSYHANENAAETGESKFRLKMRFDGPSLVRLLSEAELSVWGGNRPSVLTWLAIEGPSGRFVVNNENNPLLTEVLQKEAARRGVPLVMPLMDLEDERLVTVSDIWGQFSDRISAASVRYSPDAVYSGRFYRSGNEWHAYWLVQVGTQRQAIELKAEQVRELFSLSVDALAEILADKYAVVLSPANSGEFAFKVIGVKSIDDYARLTRYLESLQIVERVEVSRLDDTGVAFRVALKGATAQFLSVLALDSTLVPDNSGFEEVEPSFFWRP